MRPAIVPFLVLLGACNAALATSNAQGTQVSVTERLESTQPFITAHRGCWAHAPENSLKATKACVDLGVDMAEGDVRRTKDGVLVVLHDERLDRTTNLSGLVKDHTYSELTKARLREGTGGKDAPLTDERIPRLSNWLDVAKGRIYLLLHVKEPYYDQIYDTIAAQGAQDRVVFLVEESPTRPALRAAKFIGKSAYIGVVWQCSFVQRSVECHNDDDYLSGRAFDDFRPLHPVAYFPVSDNDVFLEKSFVAPWRSSVKMMGGLGEDRQSGWNKLLGANGLIITDHPEELIALLKSKGLRP